MAKAGSGASGTTGTARSEAAERDAVLFMESLHQTHSSSVRPLAEGTGTRRFPQCRQREVRSMELPFVSHSTHLGNESSSCTFLRCKEERFMEAAVDRVMKTYGMMVNLSQTQEQKVRDKVSKFLKDLKESDEQKLTVAGLRFVRGISIVAL
jgi:hypothetical protein